VILDDNGLTWIEAISGVGVGIGESGGVVNCGSAGDKGKRVLGNRGDKGGVEPLVLFEVYKGAQGGRSVVVKRGELNGDKLLWR